MIALTLDQIAAAVRGRLVDADTDASAGSLVVSGNVFIDSRSPERDGLFVAIVGEHVDGHDFAAGALRSGASGLLVERRVGVPAVLVDSTVQALGLLASYVVDRLPGLPVVGITGSQGKTGTKDIVAQLLQAHGPTVAPAGSYNTEIGVPLTATRVTPSTRYLVLELGARGRGHIRYLTSLVTPCVGVVLNVGVAHLGKFGSRADIAMAKGELVEALPADGVAVLNADDPLVAAMRLRTNAAVVTFGRAAEADVRVTDVRLDDAGCPQFTLSTAHGSARVGLRLVGEHQAANAAAAAAVATSLGYSLDEVADLLGNARPLSRWRMEVSASPAGVTVVNDAYNANPDSTAAALQTLVHLASTRGPEVKTCAVLGEMRELGDAAQTEHEAIGRLAAELGVAWVVAVGESAHGIFRGAVGTDGWSGRAVEVPDPEAAADFVTGVVHSGDVVLVKASRAAGLEIVAAALLRSGAEAIR